MFADEKDFNKTKICARVMSGEMFHKNKIFFYYRTTMLAKII